MLARSTMRRSVLPACALAFLLSVPLAGAGAEETAVPKGEVQKHSFDASAIFPGTTRDYWVYIPRQYDPSKPACLFVCQDGVQYNAPAVFDELIAKGEIPALIGVFVMHGRVKATSGDALDRFNRSYEYDGLGDGYARFLIDELLPVVETLKAEDGRPIRLSRDPNDRAIGGSSSGAVCAFTAAWERPDSFRRVFSAIGTYVGLRGANAYPTLIRKFEPKPLRVFLEDGSNDLNIYGGDWWMANQEMERALTFAGYEVAHVWGEGPHSSQHATEIFPDAMRWLWKDHPKPVEAGKGSDKLQEIVVPGEDWQEVSRGVAAATIAVDPSGVVQVLEEDALPNRITRHDGVRFTVLAGQAEGATGGRRIEARRGEDAPVVSSTGIAEAGAVAFSPDQSLLYVADRASRWVHSFQVRPDLSLRFGQKYYHLHVGDDATNAGTTGLAVDRDGRLYAATSLGIQICDQAGRVNVVIPTPEGPALGVTFGGPNFDVLHVATHDAVYRRKLGVQGSLPFAPPRKPAAPRL
jgi:enterochelin esterase-like enzyme